jgi:transcriptional regulator with XRE-family HTH domain/tetratricopeptide (TPR) repeat protein
VAYRRDPSGNYGPRLRQERMAMGLTQEELANASGLSVRAIRDLERGRTSCPRPSTIRQITSALDLSTAARRRPLAQLPADLTDFTGRRDQIGQLTGLLTAVADAREPGAPVVAALAGVGGIGKTALAVHVAHQVASGFPDGQLYLNLRGSSFQPMPCREALARFLRDFGADHADIPTDENERAAHYRSLAASRRLLIILDDARDAAQVRPLLPGAGGCAVLVTSRNSLHDLESAWLLDLDVLCDTDAWALFRRIAGAGRVLREPVAGREVLMSCGGLPLAIRIAAARLAARPNWSVRALADRLEDAQRRLDELQAGDLAVRTSFTVSYASLQQRRGESRPALDQAFRLLGLVDGPDISLPAAAALFAAPTDRAEHALELLVDAHLLETTSSGRYRLHDLLKVFAAERANADELPDERRDAISRLLTWYLCTADAAARIINPARTHVSSDTADEAVTAFESYDEALAWLDTEHMNLVSAVGQAADEEEHEIAWKLPGAMLDLFLLRHRIDEWITTHQTGLASARRLRDWRAEIMLLNNLAGAYLNSGRPQDGLDCVQRTISILRESGDTQELAKSLANVGFAFEAAGRLDEALEALQESHALFAREGDNRRVALVLTGIGSVAYKRGNLTDAVSLCLEGLDAARRSGDQLGQIEALHLLSSAHLRLHQHEQALHEATSALDLSREAGARLMEARTLALLGRVEQDRGCAERARGLLLDAYALFTELAAPQQNDSPEAEQVAADLRALGSEPLPKAATRV